jgi:MFS family permease
LAGEERVKTAIWLYLFLFVAFFDLHAQYPILSPFALSLGAAPSFIGLIMGVYSITHLPGNILAGYGVDRFGSRLFIAFSLAGAGILLLFQAQVTDPWQLLIIRSISGFVLAFLSPACSSLLAKLARDHVIQGKLMAGNGLVHTLASVVSPAAGAYLVSKFGFTQSFVVLGWILMATGVLALFGIKDRTAADIEAEERSHAASGEHIHTHGRDGQNAAMAQPSEQEHPPIPWLFFIVPLALSCSQGILFFELPLMKESLDSIVTSGILFSMVSIGALITLSMLFLAKISPFLRTAFGSLALALTFFGMAIRWPLPIEISLILIGLAKGVIYPAISTLLITITSSSRYGRVFSLLSIAFSIGAFFGPILAGQARDHISPYFIAFLVLMAALLFLAPTRSMTWRSANARS